MPRLQMMGATPCRYQGYDMRTKVRAWVPTLSMDILGFRVQYIWACKEGSVPCREGSVLCREGSVLCREGSVLCREGSVLCREGSVLCREGSVLYRCYMCVQGGQCAIQVHVRLLHRVVQCDDCRNSVTGSSLRCGKSNNVLRCLSPQQSRAALK
jgi:hypothetical protein